MDYSNYETTNYDENKKKLFEELDRICSYLARGEMWHKKAGNGCRKVALRGFGRLHDCEAKGDMKSSLCLDKIIMDKLKYSPKIDISMIDKAEKYFMNSLSDFKSHFDLWINHEHEFIECLNKAINYSRSIDMQLYNELCCLQKEVQEEKMRAKMIYDSLELGGWSGHDMSVKSKWIHDHFENHDDFDINIG